LGYSGGTYNIDVTGYGGLEKLPDYQNIDASFEEFYTLDGELKYKSKRKTIGGVEHEKGIVWTLGSINNLVRERFHPRVFTTLDYGVLTPIDHSSVWLRTSLGASFGEGQSSAGDKSAGGGEKVAARRDGRHGPAAGR